MLLVYIGISVGGYKWVVMLEIFCDELARWSSRDCSTVSGLLFLGFGVALWSAWYLCRADTGEVIAEAIRSRDLDFDPGPHQG